MKVDCSSFTQKHMTGSRYHIQCPLKAETALRVPSSILLLMQKHRNTAGEKKEKQAGNQEFIAQTLITDAGSGSSETTPASSSHYKTKTKRQRCCFTFLGNRGTEECWIYLGLQAGISASFPRTWKIKSNTPQRSQVTGFYK